MVIVEGDYSCDTNVWMCDAAEFTTPVELKELVSYDKNYLYIYNYKGPFEIYNIEGKVIYKGVYEKPMRLELKDGVFILKTQNKIHKFISKKEVKK
jgi:hypothetical protein